MENNGLFNYNEYVNANDADYGYLVDCIDGSYIPSNAEKYLADINGDQIINFYDLNWFEYLY